jgi:hypothetical protein
VERAQDLALERLRLGRELRVVGADQVGVEPAPLLHGTERARGDADADRAAERVAVQVGVLQVRLEAPLRLAVAVGDVLAGVRVRAGQVAAARHLYFFLW